MTMIRRLTLICLALILASCGAGNPTPDPSPSEKNRWRGEQVRVVCRYEGEVIFDQAFDSAGVVEGRIVAWRGDGSVIVEPPLGGACVVEAAK